MENISHKFSYYPKVESCMVFLLNSGKKIKINEIMQIFVFITLKLVTQQMLWNRTANSCILNDWNKKISSKFSGLTCLFAAEKQAMKKVYN